MTNPHVNRHARLKPMLPVANRVLIDFSIEALKDLGLQKIYVGAGLTPPSPYQSTVRDIVADMERHITSGLYGIDVQMHRERKLLDTMGTVNYLMEHFLSGIQPNDTVVVLPCDTPHNIDLKPILEAHLNTGAAATIAALPIPWSSTEWDERSFGTIQMLDMPDIKTYADRNLFEADVRSWASDRKGQSFVVKGFLEKQRRDFAQSNLINIGFYFFRAGFLMDLAPNITAKTALAPFSDFGLHLFPLLGRRFNEFQGHNFNLDFIRRIKDEQYPFYAYFVPVEGSYWYDVTNPAALFKVNMDVLRGRIDTQLNHDFWEPRGWGYQGVFRSSILPGASILPPPPKSPQLGSIIGSHVKVRAGAEVADSIISDRVVVEENASIKTSLIFPGTEQARVIVGRGVKLENCLVTGGALTYHNTPRTVTDCLVYEDNYGGLGFTPIVSKR